MNDIAKLLSVAGRRIETGRFLRSANIAALVVAPIALLLIAVDRLPAEAFVPWLWVLPALLVAGLAVALWLWRRRRSSELHVAIAVDERLQLREKLSTALHCRSRDDAFAQAAIDDAVRTARDPRTQERLRRSFRVTPPGGWWISPLVVLLAIMISFLGQADLFSRDAEDDQVFREARAKAQESVEAVMKSIEEKPELSRELSDLLGDLTRAGTEFDAAREPEQVKRDAIKKVSDIAKRLNDILNGEKGKSADAIERSLARVKSPESGEAKELADAMAKGDFKAARDALESMLEKAQGGNMTDEQKQALADQLQNLAEQLEQLAQQQEQLEAALQQAGLDPQLAQNPQALQQAIENNQNLNEQQQQQLQQLVQAQQAAANACQGLGEACQQMAQGLANGQMGQMGQGGQMMGEQLGQMEQMQMLLQEAQAAANACMGQCQGLGQGLSMQMQSGGAFGNQGRGAGGRAPIAPTPTGSKIIKADGKTTPEGGIIARQLFDGPIIRGEAQASMREVAEAVAEGYDEALDEDELPRRYHDAQLHYFGELQKLTEAHAAQDAATNGEDANDG